MKNKKSVSTKVLASQWQLGSNFHYWLSFRQISVPYSSTHLVYNAAESAYEIPRPPWMTHSQKTTSTLMASSWATFRGGLEERHGYTTRGNPLVVLSFYATSASGYTTMYMLLAHPPPSRHRYCSSATPRLPPRVVEEHATPWRGPRDLG